MGSNWLRRASRRGPCSVALIALVTLSACSDGPVEPRLDMALLAGSYSLTELTFDPQGVLPAVNALEAMDIDAEFIVTLGSSAQIVYREPGSGLVRTLAASTRATATGLRIEFARGADYGSLLLARRLDLTFQAVGSTLTFDDAAPDGVDRARLFELFPGWQGEPLTDPVPGRLRVVFTRR